MSLLFSEIENKITELKINKIITSRKSILVGIINYVQTKIDLKKDINLNFICTHNSRRSHYGQIWAQVLAEYFKIKKFKSFSGGTISTEVSENVINSLIKCGFRLNSKVKKGILADGFLYQKERLIAQYKSKMIYTEISSLRLSKN